MELIKTRDEQKRKAIQLSVENHGRGSTIDEKEAWEKYRKLRNKVTSQKKNDEYKYKRAKVHDNSDSPANMWRSERVL